MSDSTKDEEAALATKVEAYRKRAAAREAEIKEAIVAWLAPRDNEADSVSITRVLFDLALDRHVVTHHGNGFDLIEMAYQRAVKRWRSTLQ